MNASFDGIVYSPKAKQAGPPFAPTSAAEGLSVDPVTGKIVLGNDFGFTAATLTTQREIPLDGNAIILTNAPNFSKTQLTGGSLNLNSDIFSHVAQLSAGSTAGGLLELISDNTDPSFFLPNVSLSVNGIGSTTFRTTNNSGEFQISDGLAFPNQNRFLSIDPVNGAYFFGDIDNVGNGNILFIDDVANQMGFRDNPTGRQIANFSPANLVAQIGDINGFSQGTIETITDSTSLHDFSNGALTAAYSVNGNPGVSGTFTPPLSITVEGGIITAIS